jgi:LPXTG-motif cell wall-anchored protein
VARLCGYTSFLVLLLSFVTLSTPALAAERRCGTVTAVELSDPPSGGTVSIEGQTYRVGGLGRNVHLPAATELRVGVVACALGDFRLLADGFTDLFNGSVGVLRDGARAGDAIALCGTLHNLDAPTVTNNEGLASLVDEIWFLSGTPGPNNLSPQATIGGNVCLSGAVAVSQTTRNLLIRWSLVPNPAATPAPSPTSTPAASAPAVGPGPVHQCGTFVSYRPPTSTRLGELVIGGTTYPASWEGSTGPAGSTPHNFNQVIASGVTPGSQVCLDGTVVFSQTAGGILTDFTVSLALMASPVATTSPLGSALPSASPLGSAVAVASPSQLPSTGTDATWAVVLLAAAMLVGLITFALRRRSAHAV